MIPLSKQYIATLKDVAKKLTGEKRRAFEAQVTLDYFNSKPYLAEQTFRHPDLYSKRLFSSINKIL